MFVLRVIIILKNGFNLNYILYNVRYYIVFIILGSFLQIIYIDKLIVIANFFNLLP